MLTDKWLQKKPGAKDEWAQDEAARGSGALIARIAPSGVKTFYFRYTSPDRKQIRLPLGCYDQRGIGGLTLAAAREKAGELSLIYKTEKDLRSYLEFRRREMEDSRRLEDARREVEEAARDAGTLRALLNAYIEHLERLKKPSADDVRRLLHLHVFEAHPILIEQKASELRGRDLLRIISDVVSKGRLRTAAKVRSYLRAAYALALGAETNPNLHNSFRGFNLDVNPAASIVTIQNASKPGERALNEAELREYVSALQRIPSVAVRSALQLSLYLGGQRMEQLLRVNPDDVDLEAKTVRIYDGKGRREQPRVHLLPLTDKTAAIFSELLAINGNTGMLFTSGKVRMVKTTPSKIVTAISTAMLEQDKSAAPYTMRDIRRTCETHLARLGISKEVRAQLLSHGLSGVQDRHYDRHDYMEEKRRALDAWEGFLDGEMVDNVIQIRSA